MQTKYQVEIHALLHDKRTILTLDVHKKRVRPKELSMGYVRISCELGYTLGRAIRSLLTR